MLLKIKCKEKKWLFLSVGSGLLRRGEGVFPFGKENRQEPLDPVRSLPGAGRVIGGPCFRIRHRGRAGKRLRTGIKI